MALLQVNENIRIKSTIFMKEKFKHQIIFFFLKPWSNVFSFH